MVFVQCEQKGGGKESIAIITNLLCFTLCFLYSSLDSH